ncbi:hypothetical protein [Nocardia sp. NPDC019302]|uniref:hypothetical protein n=1 Tax=Nocardia sp. NPDC019302 TaxID=3154592 RepID=UPI003410FFC7
MSGMTIALAPMFVVIVGLAAWGMSDHEGRRGALLIFGTVTVMALFVALGLYVSGKPAWVTVLVVIAGVDLIQVAVAGVMIAIGRVRRTRQA